MILGKVDKGNEKVNKRFVNCLGNVLRHYPLESKRVLNPFSFCLATLYILYKPNKETISNFQKIPTGTLYIVYKIHKHKHNIQTIYGAVFSDNSKEKNFEKVLTKETISCYNKENEREENNND